MRSIYLPLFDAADEVPKADVTLAVYRLAGVLGSMGKYIQWRSCFCRKHESIRESGGELIRPLKWVKGIYKKISGIDIPQNVQNGIYRRNL